MRRMIIWIVIFTSLILILPMGVAGAPIEMSREVEEQIREVYAQRMGYEPEELSVRSFGQFEGCWVFFMDGPFDFFDEEDEEEIGGKTFWYPNSQRLSVYRDGAILKLADAYAEGWLSADGVAQIWEVYSDGNPKTGDPLGVVLLTMFAAAIGCIWVRKRR